MVPLFTLTAGLIATWMWSKWSDAFTAQVRTCLTGIALCLIVCGLVVALGLVVGRRVEEFPAFTVLVACIGVLMAAALGTVAASGREQPDSERGRSGPRMGDLKGLHLIEYRRIRCSERH